MPILKVFNVGHGDAMLFQPKCALRQIPVLIDAGEATYNIYRQISNSQFDVMITHQDNDHIGGLDNLLKYRQQNIQNIYLPLYLPEINAIFKKLVGISRTNKTAIQSSNQLLSQYLSKIVFLHDGWHDNGRQQSWCNLAKCSHVQILNPPLTNFDFLQSKQGFSDYTFDKALMDISTANIFNDFDPKSYDPMSFAGQSNELRESRLEYFKYIIRLIGFSISEKWWRPQSANNLFRKASNDISIVMRYENERFSILFTGDAGDKILKNLIKQTKLGKTDILKIPHHGGANSVGRNILNIIQPHYAILSHGNRVFGKGVVPNAHSVKLLQSHLPPIQILSTNIVNGSSPLIGRVVGSVGINSVDSIQFV